MNTLESIERDYSASPTPSLKQTIQEVKFLNEMVALQRIHFDDAYNFLMSIMNNNISAEISEKKIGAFNKSSDSVEKTGLRIFPYNEERPPSMLPCGSPGRLIIF